MAARPRSTAGLAVLADISSNAIAAAAFQIDLAEQQWGRISVGAREHGQAFVRHGPESRSATVRGEGDNIAVGAGVRDLVILKSSHSGFAGFLRDEYTTLPDVADRIQLPRDRRDIMPTSISA
jgi:urate oxidase